MNVFQFKHLDMTISGLTTSIEDRRIYCLALCSIAGLPTAILLDKPSYDVRIIKVGNATMTMRMANDNHTWVITHYDD